MLFRGGKESVRRQIGMAIPPLGAKELVGAVLKTFSAARYDSVAANMPLPAGALMERMV